MCDLKRGTGSKETVYKLELLMKQAGLSLEDCAVASAALAREKETGHPAAAIELEDGTIVTGKTTDLLGASAAMLLNALKVLNATLKTSLFLLLTMPQRRLIWLIETELRVRLPT